MFIIDNNLSPKIAGSLIDIFPGAIHVYELGFSESEDEFIWKYASENNLHILTKDKDFLHILNLNGHPPKVIWLRCGNVSTSVIQAILLDHSVDIHQFLQSDKGLLEIH